MERDAFLRELAEMLAGMQVPRSIGVLGAAEANYDRIRDAIPLRPGWAQVEEWETALREAWPA